MFSAGFAWSVIENKWPGFEKAFLGFKPAKLIFQPDDFWDALLSDARHRAQRRQDRIGARECRLRAGDRERTRQLRNFLAKWPSSDEIGLLDLLDKRGSRLGGNTGQMLLRFIGWDGFVTSQDVVACLRDAGLDIAAEVKSKGDLAKVQAQFNAWAEETGLPYVHLSRICAMSVGENHHDADVSCTLRWHNGIAAYDGAHP